ncbi:MAG: hypothetical protein LBK57_07870 [Clostridiales Family XIII bacterium]|jgi:hypothetical protein|nr:hypothetical protein [Clostridiales Family XIII bacterium]
MRGRARKDIAERRGGKRGTAMVEAAVVFPLTIAAVMAVVYLMINLYSFTALRSALHIALRADVNAETKLTETGIVDGRVYDRYRIAAERRGISFTHDRQNVLTPYAAAEEFKSYTGNAMIKGDVTRRHFGRYYILDEVSAVRNHSLVKSAAGAG